MATTKQATETALVQALVGTVVGGVSDLRVGMSVDAALKAYGPQTEQNSTCAIKLERDSREGASLFAWLDVADGAITGLESFVEIEGKLRTVKPRQQQLIKELTAELTKRLGAPSFPQSKKEPAWLHDNVRIMLLGWTQDATEDGPAHASVKLCLTVMR